ncbi:hypothetical protein NDU88_005081 [Pleurodeles waltl]|uniref:Uncharacterized protein n=1 Tax=Pleurodeles waltl TaxID=8319 RepID=A0AAV7NMX3_PLEWA|nr:hypothetical protein NDU88_005081 [Pleurodeles waltl]
MLGGAQTPHDNTPAALCARRGPTPNSGPPASPHQENSARPPRVLQPLTRAAASPAALPGDAAGCRSATTYLATQ